MSVEASGIPDPQWQAAHRLALDHMLGLFTESSWADGLILRGSMAMLAWAGADARAPGDLDWIALDRLAPPIDEEHPYPYVETIETVQQWPEAFAGAAWYDFWRAEEEFGTAGSHPYVPPEGLHWIPDLIEYEPRFLREELVELLRENPNVAKGILFDADNIRESDDWLYSYTYGGGTGVRLLVPWQADGLEPGLLRLDFAGDESLIDPPVWTSVPRADGSRPTLVRAASRESSLAWKLLWLYADANADANVDVAAASGSGAQGKDLYDAVLLAESERTRLTPQLFNRILRRSSRDAAGEFQVSAIRVSEEEWAGFQLTHPSAQGSAAEWLDRLTRALGALSTP